MSTDITPLTLTDYVFTHKLHTRHVRMTIIESWSGLISGSRQYDVCKYCYKRMRKAPDAKIPTPEHGDSDTSVDNSLALGGEE